MSRSLIPAFLRGWLIVALLVGYSGVLARLPVPPPFLAVALTILLLLALRTSRAIQAGARQVSARSILAFHAIRLPIGAYFLVLENKGLLPAAFAIPAGWGDIAVGATAILVAVWCCPVTTRRRRTVLLLWNVGGLLDILGVLGNGARLFMSDPAIAAPFTGLPLSLLPTFVVPLVIVTHLLLFIPSGSRSLRVRPGARVS
jgi:hypothetical protein